MREKEPLHMRATHTFNLKAGEHAQIFFVQPPELQQQRDISLKVLKGGVEFSEYCKAEGFSNLMVTSIKAEKEMKLSIELKWNFYQRYLDEKREGDESVKPISITEDERKLFLKSDNLKYNFLDKRFQDWMNLNKLFREEDEDDISLGYRTLKALREIKYTAEDKFRGCGEGGVAQAVVDGMTDCGGMALIFSAVMRSNSIPARLTQGQLCDIKPVRNMNPDIKEHEFSLGLHALAEFYSPQIGWIPAETTDKGLVSFGRDRRSNPFLTRHFDFVYELPVKFPDNQSKMLHPIFIPSYFPVMFTTKEKIKGFFLGKANMESNL